MRVADDRRDSAHASVRDLPRVHIHARERARLRDGRVDVGGLRNQQLRDRTLVSFEEGLHGLDLAVGLRGNGLGLLGVAVGRRRERVLGLAGGPQIVDGRAGLGLGGLEAVGPGRARFGDDGRGLFFRVHELGDAGGAHG